MGKVKPSKGSKPAADPLTSVKSGSIQKPAQNLKTKAVDIAKSTAKAINDVKAKVLKQTVSSDDDSDASVDSDSASDSNSDSDASDSEDASSDDGKPVTKSATNGKTNGAAKTGIDSESDSESESDDEAAPKPNGLATKGSKEADSSDSSDSSDEEKSKPKKAAGVSAVNGKKATKADSDDEDEASDVSDSDGDSADSDDSEADSNSDSDSDSESEAEAKTKPVIEEAPKKRKFDAPEQDAFAKKPKTEMSSSEEKGTLFVGKLSWDTDDDMLYEAFKSCDGVVGARVITNKETGRSRGFGYVDFSSPAAAESALETMQGIEIDGRAVNLDKSAGRGNNTNATPRERVQDRARRNGDVTSPESDTLFVGNLPFDITQDEVKDFFAEAGDVQGVRLPTDMDTGKPKGFGYVTFASVEDAKKVFEEKTGAYIGAGRAARAVRLDYATVRPPREGGSFRGGGRGGGFGGRGGGGFGDRRGGGRGGGFGGRGGGGFGGRGGRGGSRIDASAASGANKIRFDD